MTEVQILLDDPRGSVRYIPGFYQESLFHQLDTSIAWRQDSIKIYGKQVPLPRLTAWYGDPTAVYRYSGIVNRPDAWTPLLQSIRERLESYVQAPFNAVLLNRYADGQQHQGYHADDEPELGPQPLIASLSFGGTRRFRFKAKQSRESFAIDLEDGSLLLMAGALQEHFVHALLKTQRPIAPRINLTFRCIKSMTAASLA